MTKVIFLDFDGVLLSDGMALVQSEAGLTHDNYLDRVEFDSDCVANLNSLLASSGAQIVLSTSWAQGNSFSSLSNCLLRNGIDSSLVWESDDPGEGSYMTPRNQGNHRGFEIAEWIDQHPEITVWCAIDDQPSIRVLGKHAVITDPARGFDKAALRKAQQILMPH